MNQKCNASESALTDISAQKSILLFLKNIMLIKYVSGKG